MLQSEETCINNVPNGWLGIRGEFPLVSEMVLNIPLPFYTTYLCEVIKKKKITKRRKGRAPKIFY